MSHRFLLRLLTNLALFILTLSCLGVVLWVIDEFLQWDILPDAASLLLRALLVAGGVIAFVIVVMNVLLSLALLAESSASRAELPDYVVSQKLKRRVNQSIVAAIVSIALIVGGLQITNQVRAGVAKKEDLAAFKRAQVELNQSAPEILSLFPSPILEGLENNTLVEQGQLGNTSKLFKAIQTSFPQAPYTSILTRANQAPYKYALITPNSISSNNGKTVLLPELYTGFPEEQEARAVEQLFAGELANLSEPLAGKFIDNTTPSTWGLLKRNGKVIAIVSLKAAESEYYSPYEAGVALAYPSGAYEYLNFHHSGPEQLFTN